ncbi:MAG: DUF3800 domain-containing protein [Methanobrevibacter sp.]|nr:DUF3800 domain-containing protein [Methanobrevibacter sp.]
MGDKYSSSKYFVIAAIAVDTPKHLNRIIKDARNDYRNIIGKKLEIKGNKINPHVKKEILEKINQTDCEITAIFLDKENLYNIPDFYKYHDLYDNLASKLAEKISIDSETTIIVDKSKNKQEEIFNFNEKFSTSLDNINKYPIGINHANSIKYKGLQIVDLIAWSIFQSLEHDNYEYIDLIEKKNVYEVFNKNKNRMKNEEPTAT